MQLDLIYRKVISDLVKMQNRLFLFYNQIDDLLNEFHINVQCEIDLKSNQKTNLTDNQIRLSCQENYINDLWEILYKLHSDNSVIYEINSANPLLKDEIHE